MAKKRIGYGDFFCVFCGDRIEKNADVCPKCGHPYGDEKFNGISSIGAGGVGWSDRVDDPTFKRNGRKNLKTMIITMLIVSAIIFAVIYFTSDMELSEMLPIFGIVMAIEWGFWLIWLITTVSKSKDWEGRVEEKKTYTQTYTRKDDDGYQQEQTQHICEVYFRLNNGKRKKLKKIDNSAWYDYLAEGDTVRFHGKNMKYYEKYDKSRDPFLPCASCAGSRDARENYCGKCGAVMLKGVVSAPAAPYARPAGQDQSAPATEIRFCPNCGAKSDGGAFCSSCGTQLK